MTKAREIAELGQNLTVDASGNAEFSGDIELGDNNKAIFGAGSDLQIYHDGDHSYIADEGTGELRLEASSLIRMMGNNGETFAVFNEDGAVSLRYDGSAKLATTSTGVDITGTLTSDGLTLETNNASINFTGTTGNNFINAKQGLRIDIDNDNNQGAASFGITHGDGTGNVFNASENGDISFYDSAGSSQSFFWDASAESLGIGTDSPSGNLHISGSGDRSLLITGGTAGTTSVQMGDSSDQDAGAIRYDNSNNSMQFVTNASEAMRIDSSGNVGIGTTSDQSASATNEGIWLAPGTNSSFSANSTPLIINRMGTGGNDRANITLRNNGTASADIGTLGASDGMYIAVGGSEAMRIDSSGKLLVGKTADDNTSVGLVVNGNGYTKIVRSSATANANSVLQLNRLTTDGDILVLQKDGSTVGSIGAFSGDLFIGQGDAALRFNAGGNNATPYNVSTGAASDNFMDMGAASSRFDDIFATNGTIQTSDRNEKQDIEALSDAEQRVAVACKGLLRKFRWKDAVAEKGDDARIHFGIIAQDLQDAFAAEGLDAGRYAMFISSTWWETQTDVPAVEAVEAVYEDVVIPAVLDEDGNEVEAERTEQQLVTEAVEAKEAYTRTDTYETLEEAPEGATERTRLGVRYPELLAFIIGAM